MIEIKGLQNLVWNSYYPPGDKSISHRVAILGALCNDFLEITNFSQGKDCFTTIGCLQEIGIPIEVQGTTVKIYPWKKLKNKVYLDCGNSGTTARLLPSILGGLNIEGLLVGDSSLSQRPMERVITPLKKLGGLLEGTDGKLPIKVERGWRLKGERIELQIPSAQIKTAILLAGLFAQSPVTVKEGKITRNHTEIILKEFGINLDVKEREITVYPGNLVSPMEYHVVGDFSSAAYFIAIGLLSKEEIIEIRDVGLNPTRTAFLEVITKMGAKIQIINEKVIHGEKMGDIKVFPSTLKGIEVPEDLIPNIIDELPLLGVLAAFAQGTTKVIKAGELRVKESDRIKGIVENLKKFGANIMELEDGFIVQGGNRLKGRDIYCHQDHRIVMAMTVAAIFSEGNTKILDSQWVNISNAPFFTELKKIAPNSIIDLSLRD
ncbi:3-phosphoshikimate 1-carboxyvinyltransferase [Anaerobranca californiensis DSM 14826]|jgi:3-phosphoshikimate 1-carboxyvinyltransferase|uniref:3-phosphoshikimate 1-carboxyvinyltransferase n=1 Tax=Anaerobranca californiensis DSM 14826 TaxID=1120989 RepID=A0A1M6KSL6_9FIRM|nr:3-phosphoshikimate 1-carboxyvinyltransferase [Anaerobranca californiensis]SHJ61866.1 3-phosphoshikimate 1-carboxyvinyltransferase [Anaerobranca californiensis DSM 14826]